jgi:hypothetical protein
MNMSAACVLERDPAPFIDISAARGVGGPRTEAGKRAVARNAVSHGLTGRSLLLPDEESRVAEEREAGLTAEFEPKTANEQILIKTMAVASVRAEIARSLQLKRRARLIERANSDWHDDQRLEMLDLADKLPSQPETISLKLRATLAGVRWMIDRWSMLLGLLESGHEWTDEHRSMALDLVGYPVEFRDPCLFPIDAEDAEKRKRIRIDLAREQLDGLERLMSERREQTDADAQSDALDGHAPLNDRELNLFRRYEREANRLYMTSLKELRSSRQAQESTTADLTKQTLEQKLGLKLPVVLDVRREESDESADLEPGTEQNMTEHDASVHEASPSTSAPQPQLIKGNRRERRARAARLRKMEKEIKKIGQLQER